MRKVTDGGIIFDEKNAAGETCQALCEVRGHKLLRLECFIRSRKVDFEGSTFSCFAINPDVAAALLDDAVYRGQPEARTVTFGLGGIERFENSALHFREIGRAHV